MSRPQWVGSALVQRTEHVWQRRPCGGVKCVLCGAVVFGGTPPPDVPEPPGWLPDHYEALTAADNNACPVSMGVKVKEAVHG